MISSLWALAYVARFDFQKFLDDPNNIKANIVDYVQGFSENTRDIFEKYDFANQIERGSISSLVR